MLVLSRKQQEAVLIGDDIEVRVTRLTRNEVRLAIKAPREVPILREEIAGRIAAGEEEVPREA